MYDIEETLKKYNLTPKRYEELLKDCNDKVNKISDLDWNEINEKYNLDWNADTSRKAQQPPLLGGAFVREYYLWKNAQNNTDDYLSNVLSEKDELFKIKKQVADQRREYNKLLTLDAREDHLTNVICKCANEVKNYIPLDIKQNTSKTNKKTAVLFFSDWHYGMVTENIWNTYDTNVCRERVSKVVSEAIEYIKFNKCEALNIVMLGDGAHGAIHTGCRVASEEDVCDQLMHVAEILAEAIGKLSESVDKTTFYSCYGNHMRTIQSKNDSTHGDNMEKIVPWWIKERLSDEIKSGSITVVESEFYEFTKLSVYGKNIICVHGDLERNFKNFGVNMNTLFTRKYGEVIDYAVMGDKHHQETFDSFGIKSTIVPSLCGTDEYANNGRLYSDAGQTLMIFNEKGRESVYDIIVT